MNQLSGSQLGRASAYVDHYDASLLYPIARQPKRAELGLVGALPFLGADVWTAFELSWLGPRGKPQVALAHITVPCESTHIIESKSLKLYLHAFRNAGIFFEAVTNKICDDLGGALKPRELTIIADWKGRGGISSVVTCAWSPKKAPKARQR